VYDTIANVTVEREGFNGVYSSESEKKITIYDDGSYVITLTGNFIDVKMAIITGTAPEPTTRITISEYNNPDDGYFD